MRAGKYEKAAISSGVLISKYIAQISASGNTKVSRGSFLSLPFISHHANPAPIVAVLVKTIEHIIQRNTSDTGEWGGATAGQTENALTDSWVPSLRPLLSCLVDLDGTVAGAQTARVAFLKPISSHSDILMDCWGLDEPEL